MERRNARLSTGLRDLTEGVPVGAPDHRIVLFDQAAVTLLRDTGPAGLDRVRHRLGRRDDQRPPCAVRRCQSNRRDPNTHA